MIPLLDVYKRQVLYAAEPVGTILTNLIGTKNMLDLATANKAIRVLFVSSVETVSYTHL